MLVRHIVFYSLPTGTLFFSHYLINGTIFEEKLLNMKCVVIFSISLYEIFLILSKIERGKSKLCFGLHV